jgi:putative transposase
MIEIPYLLRDLTIERPNQVWAADITYIPIGRGFSTWSPSSTGRAGWFFPGGLSNTMDASFCVATLEEALTRYGKPEIFNTDQGSQFTGVAFTGVLIEAGVRISMDGRGRWGFADGREAKAGIGEYFAFYNGRRLHQAVGYRTAMAVWRQGATPAAYGHVDKACALTTCPWPDQNQQQTEPLAT